VEDGHDVLAQVVAAASNKSAVLAMVEYYLGFFAEKLGRMTGGEHRQRAARLSPAYVFPFQFEAIAVLRAAIAANSRTPEPRTISATCCSTGNQPRR